MDSSGRSVGVAALLMGMMVALSLRWNADAGPNESASTSYCCTSEDGEGLERQHPSSRRKKRVSWDESVKVNFVEPLQVQAIISPELRIEGLIHEIVSLTGDQRMLLVQRELNLAKREMGIEISRFSYEHHFSLEGHEKVWDIIALQQRMQRLQEELDDRINSGLPAKRCSSDALRRCTRLKAQYRCMRSCCMQGGACDGDCDMDDDLYEEEGH